MSDVADLLPPVSRAVQMADRAIAGADLGATWQLADDDVDSALGDLRQLEARCAALRLTLVSEARTRGMQQRTGAPDIARWLADRYGLDRATARAEVDLAHAVASDGPAAQTGTVLAAGRITESRAGLVIDQLDRLPTPLPDDVLAEAERILLDVAEHADGRAVRHAGRLLVERLTVVSTDEDSPCEGGLANELSLSRLEPGWWRVAGTLDSEHAAALDAVLAALTHPQRDGRTAQASGRPDVDVDRPDGVSRPDGGSRPGGVSRPGEDGSRRDEQAHQPGTEGSGPHPDHRRPDTGDSRPDLMDDRDDGRPGQKPGPEPATDPLPRLRPLAERRADALMELCADALRSGRLPSHGGAAATVLVTISLEELRRGVGRAGFLDLGGTLTAADARRIACDCGVLPVLLSGDAQPVEHGRTLRTCPPALRRLLDLRDGGCVFPGCTRAPRACDAHHLVHWVDGGETGIDNLCLLCPHHHRQVHRQHWQLSIVGATVVCTPPDSIDPGRQPQTHHRQLVRRLPLPPPAHHPP